ncbi:hypothetical protein J2W42_006186 [Rhizobium tibeticum]|uniref:Uncharacterized protein n=1 Tax=Rhizobium tibeticum TaxID=501024 RepID=A0A1H8SWP6_9HYPH|nr:hypothetical protein [Rhizobium tibeticum]MDP9813315.1 hypothetical protein [Rhizobium tibeticum]SEI13402.1 hypothetical protein RTCCBAU85039_4935 [Rhizobium tibeticum]SEO83409.1 hypothetical protein SAMN05216228_102679 [Rhizobium tibeticum]
MQRLLRLGVPAFALAIGTFITPASASLEITSDYSALPQAEMAMNEYTGSVSCTAPTTHYVPSFIRSFDGAIIGVGYLEVQSDGRC